MDKKEWQSLTDDEIKEIIGSYAGSIKGYTRELFDKIDAKLRKKNSKQITAEELAKLCSEHHQLTQENYLLKGQVETLMEEWKKNSG